MALSLVQIMKRSYLVMTDSGGIQEEAPALGVPVLVLREVTERPEGIESGNAEMVGTSRQRILSAAIRLLESPQERSRMARATDVYGDGNAAARIASVLRSAELCTDSLL